MTTIPLVNDPNGRRDQYFDIYSRLLSERIIFLDRPVTDESASLIIAQMLHLEAHEARKDIHLYINSAGGSVNAGLAIIDTMHYISCDVSTTCIGQAASMSALLLAAGARGKRFSLPHGEIMIHQPSGGCQGQTTDLEIQTRRILKTREQLNQMLAEFTGRPLEIIRRDTERDCFLSASEAVDYGLIDAVKVRR